MPYTICPKCGAKVGGTRSCPECGAIIPFNDTQKPAPTEPQLWTIPWTISDVVKGIAFFLVALIVVSAIFLLFALLLGFLSDGEQVPLTALVLVAMQLSELAMLLAAWHFSVHKYRSGWRSLGFRYPTTLTNAVWLVVAALILAFLSNFIYSLVIISLGVKLPQVTEPNLELFGTSAGIAIYAVLAILVAPVAEETFFRGFVFQGLRRRYSLRRSAIVSAALFAVMHFSLITLLPAFVVGLLSVWIYLRTNSIWACIVFHAAYNSVIVIISVLTAL
jgi:membrane protease YdiL (CAAX protease family)